MLRLDQDGAQLYPGLTNGSLLNSLVEILSSRPRSAGVRIYDEPKLSDWISSESPIGELARTLLGAEARAVRAILFDKNPEANWALGWHQDRTIAVSGRSEVEGFVNWTVKAGITHVEPPFSLLERMITARVHLDDIGEDNGPLLIAPGSHRLGRLEESEIGATVAECGKIPCLASAGDAWVYKTTMLHASEASRRPTSRLVLQIDFSADELPGNLEWAGIG